MNRSDEKLEQLLHSATFIPPSTNLAQRIIAESKQQPITEPEFQRKTLHKEGFIKQILRDLIFPKPAYALACSMLVGILVGWQNPGFNMSTDATGTNIQIASADEELSSLFLAEVNFYE